MKETGKRLKEIRKEKGLSQEKMSRALEIKRTVYSKFELGENNVPEKHLIKFSETFGISLNWLLRGIGPKYIEDIDEKVFGNYGQEVMEMFDALSKDESMMHKVLGFYCKEKTLRSQGCTALD